MVAGALHIIRDLLLKRQHALGVHIPGAGDQVSRIGILRRQLISDQMTAVVQILPIHMVITDRMPAARLDHADAASLLRRHQI